MIATVVFALVMLMVTGGVLKIGGTYYKGALQARTQTTARNIMDEISRGIQFSADEVYGTTECFSGGGLCTSGEPYPTKGGRYGLCIGGRGYSYILDRQMTIEAEDMAVRDNGRNIFVSYRPAIRSCNSYGTGINPVTPPHSAYQPGPPCPPPTDPPVACLAPVTDPKHMMGVGMRLLELEVRKVSESAYTIVVVVGAGERYLYNPEAPYPYDTTTPMATSCKTGAGSQFCAVSRLETTVQRRVNRVE